MLKLNCLLRPDFAFRLTHDISPENLPEDYDDYESELRKEQYILSCLKTTHQKTDTDCIKDKGDEKHELSPLQRNQKTLEQLNNVINNHYRGVSTEHPDSKLTTNSTQNKKINLRCSNDHAKIQTTIRPNSLHGEATSKANGTKSNKKPRKLPVLPSSHNQSSTSSICANSKQQQSNEKCLADELQEALMRREKKDSDDVFVTENAHASTKVYPKFSKTYLDDLKVLSFNSVSSNTKPYLSSDNVYLSEDSVPDNRPPSRNRQGYLSENKQRHLSNDSVFDEIVDKPDTNTEYDTITIKEHNSTSNIHHKAKENLKCSSSDIDKSNSDAACGTRLRVADDRRRRGSGDDGSRRTSSSSFGDTNFMDLEVTHRGMHRFIPRHKDEIAIEIGDPIHVFQLDDDLWCEGVNLRSFKRGIFPSMYATDLDFLEESDQDEDGNYHFNMRFLGSVEVNGHKGDEVLCQAINKVALSRRSAKTPPPPIVAVEVSQYGIRMLDKSKTGHETDDHFTHFFALKNISFCGFHPRNERYFGFITKHPTSYRFACHVFLGEKSTRSVSDALGNAFKRFYQEYMAFTHPTEDIYME